MPSAMNRHVEISGTNNVRDLGGYLVPGGQTQWRRILRADTLHKIDEKDLAQLHDLGVRTVIDLRREDELKSAPNPYRKHQDVDYLSISLFDRLIPLSRPQMDRQPSHNILLALYRDVLVNRQDAIRRVLNSIADAVPGAVLFHCSAGKDRTGIIAAFLLAIAGVDSQTIAEDYALTQAALVPLRKEFLAGRASRGLEPAYIEALLACTPETMLTLLQDLTDRHGGLETYLQAIGVGKATVERLRMRLVAPGAHGSE